MSLEVTGIMCTCVVGSERTSAVEPPCIVRTHAQCTLNYVIREAKFPVKKEASLQM